MTMKRSLFFTLILAASLGLSACQTSNGRYDSNKSGYHPSHSIDENSKEYFNEVVHNKIYFSTNDDSLDHENRHIAHTQADWMNKECNRRYCAVIEGHCDERGTREHNLALGERRAHEVKRTLVACGVDGNRLNTVSYGKERPEVEGSNENAWAMNRRAVTILE